MKLLMLTIMAFCALVSADPAVLISGGYLGAPLSSAALIAPSSVASVAPVAPVAPVTSVVSDYRYAYGSAYTYPDTYPVVSSAALTLPYSLPYAYAADWFYRK